MHMLMCVPEYKYVHHECIKYSACSKEGRRGQQLSCSWRHRQLPAAVSGSCASHAYCSLQVFPAPVPVHVPSSVPVPVSLSALALETTPAPEPAPAFVPAPSPAPAFASAYI